MVYIFCDDFQSAVVGVPCKCTDSQMYMNTKKQCITCARNGGNPLPLGTWVCHYGPPHVASAQEDCVGGWPKCQR